MLKRSQEFVCKESSRQPSKANLFSKFFVIILLLSVVQVISSPLANAVDVTLTYYANITQHQTGVVSSGAVPSPGTYAPNSTVMVSSNSGNLSRQGFTFGGWNTLANGSGTNYTAGTGTFNIS